MSTRKWRVGTISMGIMLILLGAMLLISMMTNIDVWHIFTSWWPAILIVLGLEILIYVYFSKKEDALVKYDLLSILIIGFLGTVGIFFVLLAALGVVEEVSAIVSGTEETFDLPEYEFEVTPDIQRIVLDAGNQSMRIEAVPGNRINAFGTYRDRGREGKQLVLDADDYVTTRHRGDTAYVTLKDLPRRFGLVSVHISSTVTVAVPAHIDLEVRGRPNLIMYPGDLQATWQIESGTRADVYLHDDSDVTVFAADETYRTGEGTHTIRFLHTDHLNLHVYETGM